MPKPPPSDNAKFRSSATRDGNGPGWGGPAKGVATAERQPKSALFDVGNQVSCGIGERDFTQRDRAQVLKNHLYNLATTAEREETQVRAAEAWLNRIEGTPVQRNINVNVDDLSALDEDALDARAAEIEAKLRAGEGGDVSPSGPKGPARVVN